MKTIFVTGNHPRHIYVVKKFTKYFKNFIWVIEKREININHKNFVKKSKLYKQHIKNFQRNEKIFFTKAKYFERYNHSRISYIVRNKTNSKIFNETILEKVNNYKPNFLFSYGCQKIEVNNFKRKNIRLFNIHGGLLPKYKGVNTNFWPHVNGESNLIGLTLHKLNEKIDSGDIFFQTSVDIAKKDTINKLSCKAIINFCEVVPKKIFFELKKNFRIKGIKFKSKRKAYKKVDFKVSYIREAYKKFNIFLNVKKIKNKVNLINIS
jgi:methionyl-tRNA formyltransferase